MFAALFFGVGMGTLTGIIPGFHVNNVALILLALAPALFSLGIPLSAAEVGYFSDGEINVQIEDNVRGHDTSYSPIPNSRLLINKKGKVDFFATPKKLTKIKNTLL